MYRSSKKIISTLYSCYCKHLLTCEEFTCKSVYFKCPGYYCIPWHIVCNAVWDCPWGTDEINCTRTSCPGQFRCHNTSTCIAPDSMCNNIIDCILGDDEYFCYPKLPSCPENCTCIMSRSSLSMASVLKDSNSFSLIKSQCF